MLLFCVQVNVKQLQFADGKMIGAEKYGQQEEEIKVELSPEEEKMAQTIRVLVTC